VSDPLKGGTIIAQGGLLPVVVSPDTVPIAAE
jgi:hypothetical protein